MTEKEQKRIERLLKLQSDAQLAEYDAINEIDDKVQSLHEEVNSLIIKAKELEKDVAKVEKQEGPKGEPGKSIKGEPGKDGETGPMPDHKWSGTKLSFEKPDGSWGKAVDLEGPVGPPGASVTVRRGGGGSSTGNSFPDGLILKSPNGTSFLLGVDDDGSLTTTNL